MSLVLYALYQNSSGICRQSIDECQEDLSRGLERLQQEIEQRDELIHELQTVSGVFKADTKELRQSVESTVDALGNWVESRNCYCRNLPKFVRVLHVLMVMTP